MQSIFITDEKKRYLKSFFCEAPNHTSIYTGVSWNKKEKCWLVQLAHNKKQYYGGYFDDEEHAAMKINLLCDKYEIKRKNPMITIEPDVMQQVILLTNPQSAKTTSFLQL